MKEFTKEELWSARWWAVEKMEPGVIRETFYNLVQRELGDGRTLDSWEEGESNQELQEKKDSTTPKMISLLVIRGHASNLPGAYSKYFKCGEWHFYRDLIDPLVENHCASLGVKLEFLDRTGKTRDAIGNEANIIARKYEKLGFKHRTIETHFNAFNGSASGTETLWDNREYGNERFAGIVQTHMVKALGLSDRGLKNRNTGRGAPNLRNVRHTSCLIEPFFGDNESDCKRVDERRDLLAKALVDAVIESCG